MNQWKYCIYISHKQMELFRLCWSAEQEQSVYQGSTRKSSQLMSKSEVSTLQLSEQVCISMQGMRQAKVVACFTLQ